jgi:asparagine N-glycosylation enzyme membrane subunit Stt3
MAMSISSQRDISVSYLLSVLVLIAIFLRWLPFNACFQPEGILFYGADPYLYMRRIVLTVAHFFTVPPIDFYMGFPEGTPNFFPPLFFLIIASVALLIGVGSPDPGTIEIAGAVMPPLFGAFCLIPVYLIGRHLASRRAGLIAAAVLSVMPAHIWWTVVGKVDINTIEPLLAALFFLFVSKGLPEEWGEGGDSNHNYRRVMRLGLYAGLMGWFALFTWRGSIMFIIITIVYGMFELMAGMLNSLRRPPVFLLVSVICLVVAGSAAPFVALGMWGALPNFKFGAISWNYIILLVAVSIFFLAIARAPQRWMVSPLSRKTAYVLLSLAFGGVLLWAIEPSVFGPFGMGLYWYFFDPEPLWGVSEMTSIFKEKGEWVWTLPLKYLTWAFLIVPCYWLVLAIREAYNGFTRPRVTFFLIWSVVFIVLTLPRVRFVPFAALSTSLMIGLLADSAYASLERFQPRLNLSGRVIVVAVVLAVLLAPAWQAIYKLPAMSYKFPVTNDLFRSLKWLRQATPPTSYFKEPWNQPEYGVMAQWDFGHWINYIGRRPAVATPMGDEAYGLIPQAQFFLSERNEEVDGIMVDNKIRYVIITNVLNYMDEFSRMLGVTADAYVSVVKETPGKMVDVPKPRWLELVSTRLLINDGLPIESGVVESNPPAHLRLVYESRGTLNISGWTKPVSRVKIFERLPGAVLRGKTNANSEVRATLLLKTNQGRHFHWNATVISEPDGSFTMAVPYATDGKVKTVTALSPLRLLFSDKEIMIDITEDAVQNGMVMVIPAHQRGNVKNLS